MKPRQFNTTKEAEQADKLLKDGVLIAQRNKRYCNIFLYQVEGNYIEVFIHEHFNVIIKVNRFTDTLHLEPYLSDINIDRLLSHT
ncbi:MAG: hypothetical protein NVS1B13_11970 [Flavisolibacter sp.]